MTTNQRTSSPAAQDDQAYLLMLYPTASPSRVVAIVDAIFANASREDLASATGLTLNEGDQLVLEGPYRKLTLETVAAVASSERETKH